MTFERSIGMAMLTILTLTGCGRANTPIPTDIHNSEPETPTPFSVNYPYSKAPHPNVLWVDMTITGLTEGDVATVYADSPRTEIEGMTANSPAYEFPLPEYDNTYTIYLSALGYSVQPAGYTIEVIDKAIYIVEGEVRKVYSEPVLFEFTPLR